MVSGRGVKPAKVLFIGQAPGKTEDLRGVCFIGRAGKVLDLLLEDLQITYWIDNCVPCLPPNIQGFREEREPLEDEVLACVDRLMKIYYEVKPELVIFLGRIAEKYYKKIFREGVYIVHPSYLARGGRASHPEFIYWKKKLMEVVK